MHIDDDIIVIVLCCLASIVGVIIISIKERENILRNLSDFFKDWWYVIKSVCVVFAILLFIAYCISLGI